MVGKSNSTGKLPIPRLNNNFGKFSAVAVSPKRNKNAKYKTIQPKPEPCDIGAYNSQYPNDAVDFRSHPNDKKQKNLKSAVADSFKTEIDSNLTPLNTDVASDVFLARERLISVGDIDKSALDDYLGTNNSQEHEEELVKYFENKDKALEQDVTSKLSQLRQLLITQQHMNLDLDVPSDCSSNLQENGLNLTNLLGSNTSAFTKTNTKNISGHHGNYYHGHNYNSSNGGLSARRRVSFETLQQEDAVPPSPNTRRKNFNFTPISPGPLSPNGRQSKCSSTTVSPFVSPRNTPVPRAKANMHQNVSSSYVVNQTNASVGVPNYQARKPLISDKLSQKIKQEADTHNEGDRIINQIGESEMQSPLIISTEISSYLPMSAPPSPKLPIKTKNANLLQKLLNSNNKVAYTPNYSRSQSLSTNVHDPLSSEISQLFSSNVPLNTEANYRSQSVPLHQMSIKSTQNLVQNSLAQFPFISTSTNPIDARTHPQSEFNDFDSFSANENINMTKILNTLDAPPQSNSLYSEIPLENDLALAQDNYEPPETSINFEQQNLEVPHTHNILPSLRCLGRSQSIDVDICSDMSSFKFNPSRSVPGTPVPSSSSKNQSKNYRSYPSTPLTIDETFSFNHGQDYLLNGQPIKEKVSANDEINQNLSYFQNSEGGDEIYNNVDMFNVNDTNLNCDILIGDNKNNFNFEGQLTDGNFGVKNTILEDGCGVNGSEFDFKNGTE